MFLCCKKINTPLQIGVLFGVLHFILVIFWDIIVKIASITHPESFMMWLLFGLIDLPLILILKLFGLIDNPVLGGGPYIIFGILGSLQYFFFGWLLGFLFKRKVKD